MYDADQNGVMSYEEFVSLHGFLNLVCVHPLFFLIMPMLICCTCNWIELSVFPLDKGMQVSVYENTSIHHCD
jgi:hypothetical protein